MRTQLFLLALALLGVTGSGQVRTAPAPKTEPLAATVNGQPLRESLVRRGLKDIPKEKWPETRPELLDFFIGNMLVDQYLVQQKITVDKAEADKRIADMRKKADPEGKNPGKFDEILKAIGLSEAELREHNLADIRWDKFAATQATDKALRAMFDADKEMFNGSMVRARHILLTADPKDAKSMEQAQIQLADIKKQIEGKVNAGLAALPANTDAQAREKTRTQLLEEAFVALAKEKSKCPSAKQGGDVSWFQRSGFMVEPFARASFSLKPLQMSDVVKTQFGYHLILVTDRKPGKEVKFEDVQNEVKEFFSEKLRQKLISELRPRAKIEIFPAKE